MDTFIHFGIAASVQAVDRCWLAHRRRPEMKSWQPGSVVSSWVPASAACRMIEATRDELCQARGPRRISPFFVPASIINMIAGHVSMRFGFKGPNIADRDGLHHRAALHWRRPGA